MSKYFDDLLNLKLEVSGFLEFNINLNEMAIICLVSKQIYNLLNKNINSKIIAKNAITSKPNYSWTLII